MSNTGVRTQDSHGSIVIENHDLIADIEQDRYIANALEHKRFIFGRFPFSLEKEYQLQGLDYQSQSIVDALSMSAIMLFLTCIFEVMTNANLYLLQLLMPVMIAICVGIVFSRKPLFLAFSQVYALLTLALLGFTTQTAMLENQSASMHWMLAFGMMALIFCARIPLEMPVLIFMALITGVVCMAPEQMAASGFYFSMFVAVGLALWLWREDVARRRFLQVYVPPNASRTSGGLKETQRARQLVVLDKQTGLANNTSFMRFFSNEWQRAFRARQSLSLILISLDVTITKLTEHGHLDRVLTELQRYSRRPGDLVGKTDARSFAVLLSNTDIANSRRLAESLLEHLHGLDLGQDGSLKVFMGVASTLPMPSMSHENLYAKAQEALVAAEKKTTE